MVEGETEEEGCQWERRRRKRENCVAGIKKSPAYILVSATGRKRAVTPDPYDKKLSKRAWEASAMRWRQSLRDELHELHVHWED